MLDEIISYVQSLQNQVEFLSMKLASLNPMMYEFGLDIDMYSNVPQVLKMGMAQIPHELVQCMGQGNQLPTGAPHTSLSLEEALGPTGFVQDGGSSSTMQVGGEQGLEGSESLHQVEFSSMCFFQ